MDKGAQEKVISPLFSVEERNNIVRSFIEAYIRGAVQISFPTREEAEKHKKEFEAAFGRKIDPLSVELSSKDTFERLISTATGALKATESEIQEAIDNLFSLIISYRQGDRIKGEFLEVPNFQRRLSSLEEKVANI